MPPRSNHAMRLQANFLLGTAAGSLRDRQRQAARSQTYSVAPPPAASAAAATPPKRNAASATSAAAASMTASAASVAASAASVGVAAVAASVPDKLYAGLGRSDVFLVEDIERRQADVRDFLFTESDFVRCRPNGCSRCAAHHRQGQPGCPQQRHGACSTLPLRRFLRARHVGVLPYLRGRSRIGCLGK